MAIKSGQLKEKTDYQAYILEMLRDENGYQIRPATSFEAGYGMDTEVLFNFLEATQNDAAFGAIRCRRKSKQDKAHRSRRTMANLAFVEIVCEEQHRIAPLFYGKKKGAGLSTCSTSYHIYCE